MKSLFLFLVILSVRANAWTLLGGSIEGWAKANIVVYVNSSGCTIEETKLLSLLDAAINSWNGIPTANVTLSRQLQTGEVDVASILAGNATELPFIVCDPDFSANNATDGDYVPAATRVLSSGTGPLDYAGVFLNAEEGKAAEISQLSDEELLITVAHELGHVLGLGHSSSEQALMYYSISGKTRALVTQDDADGMSYLYPRNEFGRNPFGASCNAIHTEGSLWHPGWIWFVGFLFLNLYLGRRFRIQT